MQECLAIGIGIWIGIGIGTREREAGGNLRQEEEYYASKKCEVDGPCPCLYMHRRDGGF